MEFKCFEINQIIGIFQQLYAKIDKPGLILPQYYKLPHSCYLSTFGASAYPLGRIALG